MNTLYYMLFVFFNNQAGAQLDVLQSWTKFSDFQGTNWSGNNAFFSK